MNNLVTKASELIYQMDNDQLNQVIEAVKLKRQHLSRQAVRKFTIGDMVQFKSSKTGGKVNATVEKVNRKYVVVSTHIGGEKWRVPATMLTPLNEIA
jgi:Cu/Ag efflux protein CusF